MNDLQQALERAIGDVDVDVDGSWRDVRRSLERGRRRRRVGYALGGAFVVAAASVVTIRDLTNREDHVVVDAGPTETAVDPTTSIPHPPTTERPARGELGDLAEARSDEGGIATLHVSFLDGASVEVSGTETVIDALDGFFVAARATVYCEPRCGSAEVVADLRDAGTDIADEGRFVQAPGELVASVGPWRISAGVIVPEEPDMVRWQEGLLAVPAGAGWSSLELAGGLTLDDHRTSVEFTRREDRIEIRRASCPEAMGPVPMEFDDGTEYYIAVVCEPAVGITTHITGSRQFVETMFSGLRYGQG